MAESTTGWFGVREKYCSLTDKPRLISQIRAAEQADSPHYPFKATIEVTFQDYYHNESAASKIVR